MSQSNPFLLETRGTNRDLGSFVVAARFSRDSKLAGFALGDGSVWTLPAGTTDWTQATLHDGAILSMAVDPSGGGFITGGDDGNLKRLTPDGAMSDVASFGMKWVEHVATYALDKGRGLIA